ncbi:MAG: hypothetical protein V3U87_02280 [Methylococcaceae bacterium]
MNGSYDPYPDFSPLYETTSFSWWLFSFGMPGNFKGYYPNYSKDAIKAHNYFIWAILKAHTRNTAGGGAVTLRSKDPQDVSDINFRYFDEGNDISGDDLKSVNQWGSDSIESNN